MVPRTKRRPSVPVFVSAALICITRFLSQNQSRTTAGIEGFALLKPNIPHREGINTMCHFSISEYSCYSGNRHYILRTLCTTLAGESSRLCQAISQALRIRSRQPAVQRDHYCCAEYGPVRSTPCLEIVLALLCWYLYSTGTAVLALLCWHSCAGICTVLVLYWHSSTGTAVPAPLYRHCCNRTDVPALLYPHCCTGTAVTALLYRHCCTGISPGLFWHSPGTVLALYRYCSGTALALLYPH